MISYEKQCIIDKFNNCVKGVEICLSEKININHCGKEGHWLETKMGMQHNSKNEPDIMGYEMKKISSHKITLGDFGASEYAFSGKDKRTEINKFNLWSDEIKISRNDFITYFGNPNPLKNNRHSWSGACVPTYNTWNANGQTLTVLENGDVVVYYSYESDERTTKHNLPHYLQIGKILTVIWKSAKLRKNINNKFNKNGFFICKKVGPVYNSICFGKPFDFEYFIECIKNKKVIFDSGMYAGNSRNYSHFRGSQFWAELLTDEH